MERVTANSWRFYRHCVCPHCGVAGWNLVVRLDDAPVVLECDVCGAQWLAVDE